MPGSFRMHGSCAGRSYFLPRPSLLGPCWRSMKPPRLIEPVNFTRRPTKWPRRRSTILCMTKSSCRACRTRVCTCHRPLRTGRLSSHARLCAQSKVGMPSWTVFETSQSQTTRSILTVYNCVNCTFNASRSGCATIYSLTARTPGLGLTLLKMGEYSAACMVFHDIVAHINPEDPTVRAPLQT